MKSRLIKIVSFLTFTFLLSANLSYLAIATPRAVTGPVQFPGNKIQQFAQPLPLPDAAGGTIQTIIDDGSTIPMRMVEVRADILPPSFKPANGLPYAGTAVFSYRVSENEVEPLTKVNTYVNPLIIASRGTPTSIRYINNLTTNIINWRAWTDASLHSAFHQAADTEMPISGDTKHYEGPVLAVPHLHGGEVPALVDGGPEAWFASDVPGPDTSTPYLKQGPAYYSKDGAAENEAIYTYPNTQEAAPLWFHDHLLGGTRLNATFSGLAGGYALTDPDLVLPDGLLPVGLDVNGNGTMDNANEVTIPLVIQDRMFDTNGELFFPTKGINSEHTYWVPEFVGDTIVVNGKAWPYLNVDQQRYRFYAINGSNSRPYNLFLQDTASKIKYPMWVISTDGGYLDKPILINPNATSTQVKNGIQKSLMMMPGERYELIIDFSEIPTGTNIVLRNDAMTVNGNPKASLDGRIIQFRVTANTPNGGDRSYNPLSEIPLRAGAPIVRLPGTPGGPLLSTSNIDKTRLLTLNEVLGTNGPLEALVNNSKWNGMRSDENEIPNSTMVDGPNQEEFSFMGNYLTELLEEGSTEVWEIVNLTMDSHPIHLHGLQFQLIDRQIFDMKAYMMTYGMSFTNDIDAIDPATGLPYANGVYIPGYGPPLDYLSGNTRALGGNPDPVMIGTPMAPRTYEAGWKDTVIMNPGEKTRIAVRVAPTDKLLSDTDLYWDYEPNAGNGVYVWHCHITDHEDNEMMRPYAFVPNPDAVRTFIPGEDY
ncbi:MAG: multicopper oxidase domain-containing protein [Clostridiaceae bacterium]